MKFLFEKINNHTPFKIEKDGLNFEGNLTKIDKKFLACNGKISGHLAHNCDRCGDDIVLNVCEDVKLILSDKAFSDSDYLNLRTNGGEYSDNDLLLSVMECFDGIDIDYILHSETEMYKAGYFYCENCKTK